MKPFSSSASPSLPSVSCPCLVFFLSCHHWLVEQLLTTLLLSIALKIPTNSSYYALEQDTAKVCFEIGSNTHFGLYQAGLRTIGLKNIWIIGLLLVSEKAWLVVCNCKLRRCNVCAEPTLNVCACGAFWGLRSATTILHIILALMKTISFLLVYITIFSSKMEDFSNCVLAVVEN